VSSVVDVFLKISKEFIFFIRVCVSCNREREREGILLMVGLVRHWSEEEKKEVYTIPGFVDMLVTYRYI